MNNAQEVKGSFATFGLIVVFIVLIIYSVGATMLTLHMTAQVSESVHMSDLYQQAHYEVFEEDSLLHRYYLHPTSNNWSKYQNTINNLTSIFRQVQHDGDNTDRKFIAHVLTEQDHYQSLTTQSAKAINSPRVILTNSITVDEVFDKLELEVCIAEATDHQIATQNLDKLHQTERGIMIATSIVFALSMLSLMFFWLILRSYQCKLNKATEEQLVQLERAALSDSLTGLGNHRAFQEDIYNILEQNKEQNEPLSLALVDVDEFKLINDTHGHPYGDLVLSSLAIMLQKVQAGAKAYRLGGDEFALILPGISMEKAFLALEQLRQQAPHQLFGTMLSIGVARANDGINNKERLQEQADAALYVAKERGRNRVATVEDIQEGSSHIPSAKARALQHLLAEGNLSIAFQPIWDLTKKKILAFEALTRPATEYGFAGPQEAFDIAEQMGHAVELDRICLKAILARANELPDEALLFINLSPQTLDQGLLAGSKLVQDVREAGLAPERVVLEITERSTARRDVVVREAQRLRNLGFRLALDDTGAGNSGLEILSQLSVDVVKIDRMVVTKAVSDNSAHGVLAGIIAIAHATSAYIVAEGIENVEQLEMIQQMGVQGVQGYLLGRPGDKVPEREKLEEVQNFLHKTLDGVLVS